MGNMSWEIHTQTYRDDKSVAGYHIHRETPKMHEPGNLNDGGGNTEDDDTGTPETPEKDENCEENGKKGGDHVLVQLTTYHLVCLPVRISTKKILE